MTLQNDFTIEAFNHGKDQFSLRIRSVNTQIIFSGEGYKSRTYARKFGKKLAARFDVNFKDLTTK